MIPKAERDADAAILAALPKYIEVDEDGSVWDCPGHGAHVARVGDVTDADIRKAAAHAVNRLPVYIEAAAEMERLKTLIAETAQRHEKEAKGLRKRGNADAAALKMAFSEELYRVLGEFWMGPEATKDFERLLRGSK